jgi:hypothetical protein
MIKKIKELYNKLARRNPTENSAPQPVLEESNLEKSIADIKPVDSETIELGNCEAIKKGIYKELVRFNELERDSGGKKYICDRKERLQKSYAKSKPGSRDYDQLKFCEKNIQFTEKLLEFCGNLEKKIFTVDENELINIKNKIEGLKKEYKTQMNGSQWYNGESGILKSLLYKFPNILEKEIREKVLDVPSDEINAFWPSLIAGVLSHLEDNIEYYPELAKEVLKKMYEVYKIDNARELRQAGGVYPGSGVVLTTAGDCIMSMESFGRKLGMAKEETYKFLGTSAEEIEVNEKVWNEEKSDRWAREATIGVKFN